MLDYSHEVRSGINLNDIRCHLHVQSFTMAGASNENAGAIIS